MNQSEVMVTKNEAKSVQPDKVWYVYLLQCADKTLYCGITTDIVRRLQEHNRGRGARYTRGRAPITLLGHAPFLGRAEALRVEYCIKQQPKSHKLALLASLGGDGFRGIAAASVPTEGILWKK